MSGHLIQILSIALLIALFAPSLSAAGCHECCSSHYVQMKIYPEQEGITVIAQPDPEQPSPSLIQLMQFFGMNITIPISSAEEITVTDNQSTVVFTTLVPTMKYRISIPAYNFKIWLYPSQSDYRIDI